MKACPLCGSLVTYEGLNSIDCKGRSCQNYPKPVGDPETGDYLWALKQAFAVEYYDTLSDGWREYLPSSWYGQPGRFIPDTWRRVQ